MNPNERRQLPNPNDGEMNEGQIINQTRAQVDRQQLNDTDKKSVAKEAFEAVKQFWPSIQELWAATDQNAATILGLLPDADEAALAHVAQVFNSHDPLETNSLPNVKQTVGEAVFEPRRPYERQIGNTYLQSALPTGVEMGTEVQKPDGKTAIVPFTYAPIEASTQQYVDRVLPLYTGNNLRIAGRTGATLVTKGWSEFQKTRFLHNAVKEALAMRPYENTNAITAAVVAAMQPMLGRIEQYKFAMGGTEAELEKTYQAIVQAALGYNQAVLVSDQIEGQYVGRMTLESDLMDKFAEDPFNNVQGLLAHVQQQNDQELLRKIGAARAEMITAPAKIAYLISQKYAHHARFLADAVRIADMRTQIYGLVTVAANYHTAIAAQEQLVTTAVTLFRTRAMRKANRRFTDAVMKQFQDTQLLLKGQLRALDRQVQIFEGGQEGQQIDPNVITVLDPNKDPKKLGPGQNTNLPAKPKK